VRTLIVLLLLASGFGLAALWQSRHVNELRADQRAAWEQSDGEVAETESGMLAEGWAAVIVGAPSGADPLLVESLLESRAPSFPPDEVPDGDFEEATPLGDFEMEVQPGQTLSGIAEAHYGTASNRLVQALAAYNEIEDPNTLRSGAWVLLPELERLTGEQN